MSYKLLNKMFYKDFNEYTRLYNERFNGENACHLNLKIHENEAFFCFCPELFKLCNDIFFLNKKVYEISSTLPEAAIVQFTTKCLIDEIILTNDIEGVYSTRKEINRILTENDNRKKQRFKGLVTKYRLLNNEELSLKSCEDIRKIYNELVLPEVIEDDPSNAPDGKLFRKEIAEVTTSTQKVIHQGVYPESTITDYMQQALKILDTEALPSLIKISVFHYLFGYIHPFYDGNGRTSRFISSYLLAQDFEPLIGYRLSYTIKENISEYYEAFNICNDKHSCGDITPFILIFLKIIYKSFENLVEALLKRKSALDELDDKIKNLSELQPIYEICYVLLQGSLFSPIGIPKNELCETLEISESTLSKRLKEVEKAGYLIVKKDGRTKYYSLDTKRVKPGED